jgi:hypothetical protein
MIRILTQTSTTPATAGFASAYGAILMGPANLRTHQGYAYYDLPEIEMLAGLQTLELCEAENFFRQSQHVTLITDNNALHTQIRHIQKGFIHSIIQRAIWDKLQNFHYLTIDFSDDHSDLPAEAETIAYNELGDGLLKAVDHLVQTNRKISVLCSQKANKNTLLYAQRMIEMVQKDNLSLYLLETTGQLFESLLRQAIHQNIDYYIVGSEPDCHAATYIYADNPTLWLAQQTSRAYGVTPASASDKTSIALAMHLFEQRHKNGRLLSFES